jgi:hypothetical protein
MYALRGVLVAGVLLVAAASVLGPGAAAATANALFWVVSVLIRLLGAIGGLLVALVTEQRGRWRHHKWCYWKGERTPPAGG